MERRNKVNPEYNSGNNVPDSFSATSVMMERHGGDEAAHSPQLSQDPECWSGLGLPLSTLALYQLGYQAALLSKPQAHKATASGALLLLLLSHMAIYCVK